MSIKKSLKRIIQEGMEYRIARSGHLCEINKFKDPRRREIAKSFPLTKEQKEQIDDFFLTNYGEKVDYVWHQNYAAHANRFDYRFVPEILYICEFERWQCHNPAANRMLSDKNFLPLVAKNAGVRMPETIISCTNGVLRDSENHIITSKVCADILKANPVFFVKPTTNSCSGQSCKLKNEDDSFELKSNTLIFSDINKKIGGGMLVILFVKR